MMEKLLNPARILLLLVLLLLGCNTDQEQASFDMEKQEAAPPAPAQPLAPDAAPVIDIQRKLIKEGTLEFETAKLEATRIKIQAAAAKHNAYISADQQEKSGGRLSNTIVLRVPEHNFDKLLQDITAGIERFDSKEISARDVTEEFLDVQARLRTKKELENRYLELLKKALTIKDILEIEKQIGGLRAEIEAMEGRLKYLENRVAYSTLSITFYEVTPEATSFGNKFRNGFRNGWEMLIWFFVFLVNIWPFLLIALAIVLGLRLINNRRKSTTSRINKKEV